MKNVVLSIGLVILALLAIGLVWSVWPFIVRALALIGAARVYWSGEYVRVESERSLICFPDRGWVAPATPARRADSPPPRATQQPRLVWSSSFSGGQFRGRSVTGQNRRTRAETGFVRPALCCDAGSPAAL